MHFIADFLYQNISEDWDLEKDIKAATDERIYKTFRLIRQLKTGLDSFEKKDYEILHRLSTIEDLLK